ncbi:MAG TPA: prepilin-type N-terminal cleavage/methylation domain-containing protein [Oligoflexus sp.]|uniref:PulJ/GspJ family protein n=1 Tax=Oligoflexus sp. TaxID=1971216 RepID=UPI002D533145|nr:prepilin-type N-terminal cleavage/methylation domain-containing protein [Oligoflexus sp.]HYX39008.1 prepilin-type N-terminal cleavage/methylation domain-containing protein [Oligoflexus sp.]
MSPNNQNQSGMSLIELMVGGAVFSLMISIGSNWILGLQKTARYDQNRISSHKMVGNLFNLIRRDAAVQMDGGLTPLLSPPGLDILRLPQTANDAKLHYQARYQTSCQPFPTKEQEFLGKVYSDSNRSRIYQNPNSCLMAMNCPAGTWPEVSIVVTGTGSASYSPSVYPGMAICSYLVNDQVRVMIEAVYASGKSETLEAEVHQKVFLLPRRSTDELMLLPN